MLKQYLYFYITNEVRTVLFSNFNFAIFLTVEEKRKKGKCSLFLIFIFLYKYVQCVQKSHKYKYYQISNIEFISKMTSRCTLFWILLQNYFRKFFTQQKIFGFLSKKHSIFSYYRRKRTRKVNTMNHYIQIQDRYSSRRDFSF